MAVDLLARAEEAQAEFEDHKATLGDDSTEESWAKFDELADKTSKAFDRYHADQRASGAAPAYMADTGTEQILAAIQAGGLSGGGVADGGPMSFFDAIAEHEGARAMVAGESKAMEIRLDGASVNDFAKAGFAWGDGAKADLTWTGTKTGVYENPARMPGVTDLAPVVGPRVRSLCTNLTTTQRAVEWIQILSKAYGSQVTPEAQSSDPIDDSGTPAANTTTSLLGGVKPYNDFTTKIEQTNVKTIPVLHDVTEDTMEDLPQLVGLIRQFMFEDVRVAEDANLMAGDGGVNALDGMLGSKWALPTFDPTGNTDIDGVLLAIAQILDEGSFPTGIVANPTDWYSSGFLLAKDGNQNYMLGNPRASIEQLNSLWGLSVAVTPTVPAGTMIVGDFRQAIVWDRHQPRFAMSNSHNDNFGRNIVTMRLEERLAFGIRKPSAFRVISTP